jgi:hypothetical protein
MTLADIYKNQQRKENKRTSPKKNSQQSNKNINVVVRLPEVAGLIKHLEVLYSSMIIQNMQKPSNQSMWEKISWYSPGQGAVKQSQSVN